MSLIQRAERYFEFEALGTNWRTEILAGITTFLTMSYIVFVNPSILREAGMPVTGVGAATCVAAARRQPDDGARRALPRRACYPIGLAAGMGINAYFTCTVVPGIPPDRLAGLHSDRTLRAALRLPGLGGLAESHS